MITSTSHAAWLFYAPLARGEHSLTHLQRENSRLKKTVIVASFPPVADFSANGVVAKSGCGRVSATLPITRLDCGVLAGILP